MGRVTIKPSSDRLRDDDRIWLTESVRIAVSAHSRDQRWNRRVEARRANPMILLDCEEGDHERRRLRVAWHGTCHWYGRCLTISKSWRSTWGRVPSRRAAEGDFRRFSFCLIISPLILSVETIECQPRGFAGSACRSCHTPVKPGP